MEEIEKEKEEIGKIVAEVLGIRKRIKGRKISYLTSFGNKTALGVYYTIEKILEARKCYIQSVTE